MTPIPNDVLKPGQKYVMSDFPKHNMWNGLLESGRIGMDFAQKRFNVLTTDGEFWIVYCNNEDQVEPMLIEYGTSAKEIHLHSWDNVDKDAA